MDAELRDIKADQEQLHYLYEEVLPQSLTILHDKTVKLNELSKMLESAYNVAGDDVAKKFAAKENVKKYLVLSLSSVAEDIGILSSNVQQCVDVQAKMMASLADNVSAVQSKLSQVEEKQLRLHHSHVFQGDS